mgnify:CR=1 FL=1
MIEAGYVGIASPGLPNGGLTLLLDEAPVVVSDVGTNIAEKDRPKRKPALVMESLRLVRLEVSVLLDGWGEGRSVEVEIAALTSIAVPRGGRRGLPAPVRLYGGAIPFSGLVFVIDGISFGSNVQVAGGRRVRQDVTLSLVQRIEVDLALREADRRPKVKTGYRIVTMPAGQSLRGLAATLLGSASRWRELRTIKGRRFASATVKAGTCLLYTSDAADERVRV